MKDKTQDLDQSLAFKSCININRKYKKNETKWRHFNLTIISIELYYYCHIKYLNIFDVNIIFFTAVKIYFYFFTITIMI